MNNQIKDNGLRTILNQRKPYLPSNFTYQTMKRIEETANRRAKINNGLSICATILVSIALLAAAIITINKLCGEYLIETFTRLFSQNKIHFSEFIFYEIIAIILLIFNNLLHKIFSKTIEND
ncbi:MAG: hypothetical protein IKT28_03705 [Rikenellaceae bacterium]|nr:hypothetical protein [Rikenellaceae bacterium]